MGIMCILSVAWLLTRGIAADDPPTFDPCSPSPCGENAICSVRGDLAVCMCKYGYEGDPLTGCTLSCEGSKCGVNAICSIRNKRHYCSCPSGYSGDPTIRCTFHVLKCAEKLPSVWNVTGALFVLVPTVIKESRHSFRVNLHVTAIQCVGLVLNVV